MKNRPSLLVYSDPAARVEDCLRSVALTRALSARFEVSFITGVAIPNCHRIDDGVTLVPLPHVALADDHSPSRSLAGVLDVRRRLVLEVYDARRPQVLLVECGPASRRRAPLPELEALLEQASSRRLADTLVCGSFRTDLVGLERSDPTLSARAFQAILVHSDPTIARLADSKAPGVPLYYTGFVHEQGTQRHRVRPGTIIVLAGSGDHSLLQTAIDAHALLSRGAWPPLTLVAGPDLSEAAWRRLQARAGGDPRVDLRRSLPHLASELQRAAAFVSDCGYYPVVDLLSSGVPSLVVPSDHASNDPQMARARRLEALGVARVLPLRDLSAPRLSREIVALRDFKPSTRPRDFQGAERSARILETLCQAGVPRHAAVRGADAEEVIN